MATSPRQSKRRQRAAKSRRERAAHGLLPAILFHSGDGDTRSWGAADRRRFKKRLLDTYGIDVTDDVTRMANAPQVCEAGSIFILARDHTSHNFHDDVKRLFERFRSQVRDENDAWGFVSSPADFTEPRFLCLPAKTSWSRCTEILRDAKIPTLAELTAQKEALMPFEPIPYGYSRNLKIELQDWMLRFVGLYPNGHSQHFINWIERKKIAGQIPAEFSLPEKERLKNLMYKIRRYYGLKVHGRGNHARISVSDIHQYRWACGNAPNEPIPPRLVNPAGDVGGQISAVIGESIPVHGKWVDLMHTHGVTLDVCCAPVPEPIPEPAPEPTPAQFALAASDMLAGMPAPVSEPIPEPVPEPIPEPEPTNPLHEALELLLDEMKTSNIQSLTLDDEGNFSLKRRVIVEETGSI